MTKKSKMEFTPDGSHRISSYLSAINGWLGDPVIQQHETEFTTQTEKGSAKKRMRTIEDKPKKRKRKK